MGPEPYLKTPETKYLKTPETKYTTPEPYPTKYITPEPYPTKFTTPEPYLRTPETKYTTGSEREIIGEYTTPELYPTPYPTHGIVHQNLLPGRAMCLEQSSLLLLLCKLSGPSILLRVTL